MEKLIRIDRSGIDHRAGGQRLRQVGEPDQEQEEERNRSEQGVEGESARQKRNVVFVGRLQRANDEAARRAIPGASPRAGQACGSSRSKSPAARRRRASDNRRSSS
jgi:hypothetical protein